MEEIKLTRRSGRGIRRLVTLCGTVTQLVAEYDRHLDADSDNDDDDDFVNVNDLGESEELTAQNKEEIKR
jgi:hypothetical protein